MHIVVCLKEVPDPEIRPQDIKINTETNQLALDDVNMVIDSFAENALELAIQLRDTLPDATVTAICIGDESAEDVLRHALAFTANQAVRVWDPEWESLDGQAVGHILSKTIQALGGAQVILTGYQASDIEEGLVGPVIAEELQIPCVTYVSDLEAVENKMKASFESEQGYSVVKVPVPAVFTITSSETNLPRLPKVRDRRLARTKPITVFSSEDLQLNDQRCQPGVQLERAYTVNKETDCELITGKDDAELADRLTNKLMELKLL